MSVVNEPEVTWAPDQMVQILNEPDDFLKVRETLTRIGVVCEREETISILPYSISRASIILYTSKTLCSRW